MKFRIVENKNWKKQQTRNVAIHEAGHILVNELLMPGTTQCAEIDLLDDDDNESGGITFTEEDSKYTDFNSLVAAVKTSLGSIVAIDIMCNGQADIGCSQDLEQAQEYIEKLIVKNKVFGFNSIWEEHLDIITDFYLSVLKAETKELVLKNHSKLVKLADELEDNGYLDADDIKRIMNE